MNDAQLEAMRDLAGAMAGPEPRDWEWIGPHMSQRMFGISEDRATTYAARHGGVARRMVHCACGGYVSPETNTCVLCDVDHSCPCPACGETGYHGEGCPNV